MYSASAPISSPPSHPTPRGAARPCPRFAAIILAATVLLQPGSRTVAPLRADSSAPQRTDTTEVTVRTVTDEALRGRLVSLSLRDGLVLRDDADGEQRKPTADLVRLATAVAPAVPSAAAPPTEVVVTLARGDVIAGRLLTPEPDVVAVDTADLGRLAIPLDAIGRVECPRADQPGFRDADRWFDRTKAASDDRVLLTNGDGARGFITAVGPEGVVLRGPAGDATIPLPLIVSVRFAATSPPPDLPHGIVAVLRTTGRVTLTELEWSADTVRARLAGGTEVQIDADRIVRLDFFGGRWEWLSTHEPIGTEHTPLMTLPWEHAVDRNVLGGPMVVGGESFEHGLGVHSRSRLVYDLKGAYREFVTYFGMDDDSGPYASVDVVIVVDERRRFEQAPVRRGKLFGPVRVDVSGGKRLELIVEFGANGDLQDRFDWVEPALIR